MLVNMLLATTAHFNPVLTSWYVFGLRVIKCHFYCLIIFLQFTIKKVIGEEEKAVKKITVTSNK